MIRADSDPFRVAFLATRELEQVRRTYAIPEGFSAHCRDFFGTLVPTARRPKPSEGGIQRDQGPSVARVDACSRDGEPTSSGREATPCLCRGRSEEQDC